MDLVYLSLCKMVSRYLKAVSRSFTRHTRSRYFSAPAIKGLCLHFLSHGAPEVLDITRKFMNKPPLAIQQRGIVPFCEGLDMIQKAQSGTGKIAIFCFNILEQLDLDVMECQALVLAPTHELAQRIEKVMRARGDYLGVKVHTCVGGTNVRED
ncbi:hypothetical protein LguiA_025968 [Lonicera macranthoides]